MNTNSESTDDMLGNYMLIILFMCTYITGMNEAVLDVKKLLFLSHFSLVFLRYHDYQITGIIIITIMF